jgi:soluble lytic murein transglycosylase
MLRLILAASMTLAAFPRASAADDIGIARAALTLAAGQDWPDAADRARAAGPVTTDIVTWMRLRDGEGTFGEYQDFLARHGDWPGMALLRKAGEDALGGADAGSVIGYFAALAPQTGTGCLALAGALAATGRPDDAAAEVVRGWRGLMLTAEEQDAFLSRYGEALKEHNDGRVAAMLRAGEPEQARRMLDYASEGTRKVAEARIALQTDGKGVTALVKAVPDTFKGSWGLAYDRFRWRIRQNLYDDAAALLLERSDSAESLGDPAVWADWRRTLARREMRAGHAKTAYRLASRHHLTEGDDFKDLEWLAGYIALQKLGDAETALKHFRRFRAAVDGPISLSRAGYWEGRAAEALGRTDEANAAYGFAAEYQSAFYGLLAAEKIGRTFDARLAGGEEYPAMQGASFAGSSVFQAAVVMQAAGQHDLMVRFLLHLSEGLSGEDVGRLAGQAIEWNDAHLALVLAKAAADKGVLYPRAYFPFMGMHKLDLPVPNALALAIARRESEFNPQAVSSVGARGLMQVMPGTAKMMAGKLGVAYDAGRLTSDPLYNAKLGSAYLAGLVDEFGNSPVLVAAGYNAGPGRPRQWIAERGDPRRDDVDVVDWIEAIPFRETQNYVMRVAESYYVYRARLGEDMTGVSFTEKLKGR